MERRAKMFQVRALPTGDEQKMMVEGRAVVFDSPTVLFESGGIEYKEQISRNAFDGCDMSDVIFVLNHDGAPIARNRNGTLSLELRSDGLYMSADVGGTAAGRELYEMIAGGYIDRMSFSFVPDEEDFDEKRYLWTVRKIRKLYDVSAVSIPAYADTSISARKKQAAEDAVRTRRRRLLVRART